jgi:hypothetical protein
MQLTTRPLPDPRDFNSHGRPLLFLPHFRREPHFPRVGRDQTPDHVFGIRATAPKLGTRKIVERECRDRRSRLSAPGWIDDVFLSYFFSPSKEMVKMETDPLGDGKYHDYGHNDLHWLTIS